MREGALARVEGVQRDCRPAPVVQGVTEGESLAGTIAPSVGTLRVVVLLVHASDSPPDESVSGPEALLDGVSAWFRAVSYGRLELRVETIPRWLSLPARASVYARDGGRYIADAVAAADPCVDFSTFDVVYLAPASQTPETVVFASLNSFGVRADGREIRLWIPFDAGFASSEGDPRLVIHEAGHLLGLPDLYTANAPSTFHRWDVMAARWPSELFAWHRWKLGWLDRDQIVCITRRSTRTVTLQPLERPGGTKAVVARGLRAIVVEVRARSGYDSSLCDTGVLVYEVDQTPFKRAPVNVFPARPDRDAPERGCSALWNAPFDLDRGETGKLDLPSLGFRVRLLAKNADGSYRIRVTSSAPTP